MNQSVSLKEATWVWCRIAALSFGGPVGQISVMHRILVDEKKWVTEDQFLHALSYCMLLPGPEAQQLATYMGWLMHRTIGGLIAGLLFIVPGFVSILVLSIIYALYQDAPVLTGLFFGLNCAVIAIVMDAVQRIGRRVLVNKFSQMLAAASFVMIFCFAVPFPLILVAAAVLGAGCAKLDGSSVSSVAKDSPVAKENLAAASSGQVAAATETPFTRIHTGNGSHPTIGRAIRLLLTFAVIWFAPILLLAECFGPHSVFVTESIFFSKTAVITFGGAYAVLAHIAQQAVDNFHWLQPGEMLDGLGMAETTPGPLIMVVQFVGFMAAFRSGEFQSSVAAGILGAVVTTWVTFVPCFLWIFLGAPYVERLRGQKMLNAMMAAVTAAVVGVIVNLAVWFAMHTLFERHFTIRRWAVQLLLPDLRSIESAAVMITALAVVACFRFKAGTPWILAGCSLVGICVKLTG